jgi:hypothetical protein
MVPTHSPHEGNPSPSTSHGTTPGSFPEAMGELVDLRNERSTRDRTPPGALLGVEVRSTKAPTAGVCQLPIRRCPAETRRAARSGSLKPIYRIATPHT